MEGYIWLANRSVGKKGKKSEFFKKNKPRTDSNQKLLIILGLYGGSVA